MTLLLDTSVLIEIERENKDIIKEIDMLRKLHPSASIISFITYFEMMEGIMRRNPKNKEKEINFLNNFTCSGASKKTALILAELKTKYDKLCISLPLADIMIASLAKENDLFLVTRDNHFSKIDDIKKVVI